MNTISIGPGSVSQGSSYEACDVLLIAIAMDLVESTVYRLNRAVFWAYLSLHVKSVSNPTSGSKVAGENRWIILLMCWFHNGRISTGWRLKIATWSELKIIMWWTSAPARRNAELPTKALVAKRSLGVIVQARVVWICWIYILGFLSWDWPKRDWVKSWIMCFGAISVWISHAENCWPTNRRVFGNHMFWWCYACANQLKVAGPSGKPTVC